MALTLLRSDLIRLVKDNYGDRGSVLDKRKILSGIEAGIRDLSEFHDWEFMSDNVAALNLTPSYEPSSATSTASATHGSTTVTTTAAIPSDAVGAFMELNGERGWYEITAGASSTTVTIARAYRNASAANLSAVTFKIFYPHVDLPANYKKRVKIVDVLRGNNLGEPAVYDALWYLRAQSGGSGQPYAYAEKGSKRHDPNVQQMFFYPPPTSVETYELCYVRHAGWYSSTTPATSSWKMRSTADTDAIDWPESKYQLLEKAILAHMYHQTKDPAFATYVGMYHDLREQARDSDRENGETQQLGGDTSGTSNQPYARYEA